MKTDKRQNFISADMETTRNSHGDYFTIGEIVGHDGAEDEAAIISFEPVLD